jgi:ribulose-bisphosphate carboxylase small chain
MRITQGCFSYLPDLTDDEIKAQIQYGIDNGWAPAVEFTDDPHPRNSLWEMWGLPMFDIEDAAAGLHEVNECRKAFPNHYIKVTLYDARHCRQTTGLDFIVHRPPVEEPGFRLDRQDLNDRHIAYTVHSYATERPRGERYVDGGGRPAEKPRQAGDVKTAKEHGTEEHEAKEQAKDDDSNEDNN